MARYDPESGTVDTVASYRFVSGESNPIPGLGSVFVSGGQFVYVRSDNPEVVWHLADGTMRQIVRWQLARRYMTEEYLEDLEPILRDRLRFANPGMSEERLEEITREGMARYDTRLGNPISHFVSPFADAEGRVWLPRFIPGGPGEGAPPYTVISPEGEWLGMVDGPPGLRILDVGWGRVLGVVTDEMGVESVVVRWCMSWWEGDGIARWVRVGRSLAKESLAEPNVSVYSTHHIEQGDPSRDLAQHLPTGSVELGGSLMRFVVVIHKDMGTGYGVTVPDLPGCFSAGDTLEEAIESAQEAIACHIEGLLLDGEPVPERATLEMHQSNEDYQDGLWVLVPVDISKLSSKTRRVNITLPERVLAIVDQASVREGGSRSGWLARAALSYVQREAEGRLPGVLTDRPEASRRYRAEPRRRGPGRSSGGE